jgi:hypothetical protein
MRMAIVGLSDRVEGGRVSNLSWSGDLPVLHRGERSCSQAVRICTEEQAVAAGVATHWVGELTDEYLADRCE